MSAYLLDVPELYRRMDVKRREQGLDWKRLAGRLDVSASTFSRMAAGNRPDADALVTILVWLDLDTDIAIIVKPRRAS